MNNIKTMKSLLDRLKNILPHKKKQDDGIKIDKDATGIQESEESQTGYLIRVQSETLALCELLNAESDSEADEDAFSPKVFFEEMYSYVENDNRLVYSSITNYIFSLANKKDQTDQIVASIITNLQSAIDYTGVPEFEIISKEKNPETVSKTKKYMLKLWDHINLAQRQYDQITEEEEYFKKLAETSVKEATKPIADELNKQLVSLVAIFSALSFVVFGGISSLSGMFASANELPILKFFIYGSLWALCMVNVLFIFIFFISNLVGKSIASSNNINDNIIKKYPLIFFSNWIFTTMLLVSIGVYLWKEYESIFSVIRIAGQVVPVIEVGFAIIAGIDVIVGIVLLIKLFKA